MSISTERIIEKARRIAAHMLEADPADMVFEDGVASVKGSPDRGKTIQEIAAAAAVAYDLPDGEEPFLDDTAYYDPPNCTFPFGTHVAVVEIDPRTGEVSIRRYVAVDDVGRVINPLIVDGQVHGGIAQGVAQALWEGAVYDDERAAAELEPDGLCACPRRSSSHRSRSTAPRHAPTSTRWA